MSPPPLPPRPLELAMGNNLGGEAYGNNNPTDIFKSITSPTESDKSVIIDLAVAAMEELMRMAQVDDPLWKSLVLDEEEYARMFPGGIGPRPAGFRSEASRESAVVIMNHVNLVEILMDVIQWSTIFAGMVSRAMTLAVLSTGVAGNYNGALQVMTAEFQVPSPLVPTRETYFAHYCKQQGDGSFAVVDISLDSLQSSPPVRCRRRASGCLIQEMPNGYS